MPRGAKRPAADGAVSPGSSISSGSRPALASERPADDPWLIRRREQIARATRKIRAKKKDEFALLESENQELRRERDQLLEAIRQLERTAAGVIQATSVDPSVFQGDSAESARIAAQAVQDRLDAIQEHQMLQLELREHAEFTSQVLASMGVLAPTETSFNKGVTLNACDYAYTRALSLLSASADWLPRRATSTTHPARTTYVPYAPSDSLESGATMQPAEQVPLPSDHPEPSLVNPQGISMRTRFMLDNRARAVRAEYTCPTKCDARVLADVYTMAWRNAETFISRCLGVSEETAAEICEGRLAMKQIPQLSFEVDDPETPQTTSTTTIGAGYGDVVEVYNLRESRQDEEHDWVFLVASGARDLPRSALRVNPATLAEATPPQAKRARSGGAEESLSPAGHVSCHIAVRTMSVNLRVDPSYVPASLDASKPVKLKQAAVVEAIFVWNDPVEAAEGEEEEPASSSSTEEVGPTRLLSILYLPEDCDVFPIGAVSNLVKDDGLPSDVLWGIANRFAESTHKGVVTWLANAANVSAAAGSP